MAPGVTTLTLPVPSGRRADEVAAVLAEARADDPDEQLWRGVDRIETGPDGVTVDFATGVDPRLREVDGVRVACHLHDARLVGG